MTENTVGPCLSYTLSVQGVLEAVQLLTPRRSGSTHGSRSTRVSLLRTDRHASIVTPTHVGERHRRARVHEDLREATDRQGVGRRRDLSRCDATVADCEARLSGMEGAALRDEWANSMVAEENRPQSMWPSAAVPDEHSSGRTLSGTGLPVGCDGVSSWVAEDSNPFDRPGDNRAERCNPAQDVSLDARWSTRFKVANTCIPTVSPGSCRATR